MQRIDEKLREIEAQLLEAIQMPTWAGCKVTTQSALYRLQGLMATLRAEGDMPVIPQSREEAIDARAICTCLERLFKS